MTHQNQIRKEKEVDQPLLVVAFGWSWSLVWKIMEILSIWCVGWQLLGRRMG
jgi:hypothetical protein